MPAVQMTDLITQVSMIEAASQIEDRKKSVDLANIPDEFDEDAVSQEVNEAELTADINVAAIDNYHKTYGNNTSARSDVTKTENGHMLENAQSELSTNVEDSDLSDEDVDRDHRGESSQTYATTQDVDNLTEDSHSEEKKGLKRLRNLTSKDVLDNLSHEQCERIANDVIDCYDSRVYHPIRAGQHKDEVNVPIMSPPPVEKEPKYDFGEFRASFCRSLAVQFMEGHELKACKFASVKTDHLLKTLAFPSNNVGQPECICSSQNIYDDSISGWETPPKFCKSKSGKKRKSRVSSETAFSRLTGQLGLDREDPFSFQHFKDPQRFIEHYRFLNTVGGVCSQRPMTTKPATQRNIENDAYYNKLRSAFCAMASSFDLRTMLQDRDNASSSSSDRNDKNKSDDESVEETNNDNKVLSMKDRGKTLNLAPVRECTVPDLIQADNFDQLQQNYATINQYLNLMTPPLPANCLQLAYEAAKARRHGTRLANAADNHLFPGSSPRRGATPLRLGSAEFVKPGTPEHLAPPEVRWSSERKSSMQRSSTFHGSTVPGSLYVGSTVSPSQAQMGRSKSSGKPTTYNVTQSPHHHLQHHSKDAPHQIYGKKFKPCERVNELTKERGRGREDKVIPQYLTSGVEPRDNYGRKQDRLISVNVNHLGIRGRTFIKPEELTVFYKFDKDKNRRVATLTSKT